MPLLFRPFYPSLLPLLLIRYYDVFVSALTLLLAQTSLSLSPLLSLLLGHSCAMSASALTPSHTAGDFANDFALPLAGSTSSQQLLRAICSCALSVTFADTLKLPLINAILSRSMLMILFT
jgi:hypothetical protein